MIEEDRVTVAAMPIGTRVIARKNVGALREGMLGIVTGSMDVPYFFWKRLHYLCTFVGNFPIAVKPSEVEEFDHGYNLADFQNPEFVPDMNALFDRVVARHSK